MTLKKLFDKVDTYNEIADLMRTQRASIYFTDGNYCFGEQFSNYTEFRKYIKKEYIKEVADLILKSEDWEFDKQVKITWKDVFGDTYVSYLTAELTA